MISNAKTNHRQEERRCHCERNTAEVHAKVDDLDEQSEKNVSKTEGWRKSLTDRLQLVILIDE